jgi:hypothetical protein
MLGQAGGDAFSDADRRILAYPHVNTLPACG